MREWAASQKAVDAFMGLILARLPEIDENPPRVWAEAISNMTFTVLPPHTGAPGVWVVLVWTKTEFVMVQTDRRGEYKYNTLLQVTVDGRSGESEVGWQAVPDSMGGQFEPIFDYPALD